MNDLEVGDAFEAAEHRREGVRAIEPYLVHELAKAMAGFYSVAFIDRANPFLGYLAEQVDKSLIRWMRWHLPLLGSVKHGLVLPLPTLLASITHSLGEQRLDKLTRAQNGIECCRF